MEAAEKSQPPYLMVHNVINPQRVEKISAALLDVNQVLFLVGWFVGGFFPIQYKYRKNSLL